MSLENQIGNVRPEFNLTSSSTLNHLIVVAATCLVLWGIIVVTIGA